MQNLCFVKLPFAAFPLVFGCICISDTGKLGCPRACSIPVEVNIYFFITHLSFHFLLLFYIYCLAFLAWVCRFPLCNEINFISFGKFGLEVTTGLWTFKKNTSLSAYVLSAEVPYHELHLI